MKNFFTIICLIISTLSFCQTEEKERFRELQPDVWLGIWDNENSNKSIKIDSLNYDDIPKTIDFRGTVVEAIKWSDSTGENILIQTVTGQFNWKDYMKDSTDYMIQDKSELYVYFFQKRESDKEYKRKWRIYDYNKCYGVDWYTGFIPKATTITDIDNDGITEITIPYVFICRGGMDPGDMKIIMYEGQNKYALRGSTSIMCNGEFSYGGEFKPSENLNDKNDFKDFLIKRWNLHKCENGRFY